MVASGTARWAVGAAHHQLRSRYCRSQISQYNQRPHRSDRSRAVSVKLPPSCSTSYILCSTTRAEDHVALWRGCFIAQTAACVLAWGLAAVRVRSEAARGASAAQVQQRTQQLLTSKVKELSYLKGENLHGLGLNELTEVRVSLVTRSSCVDSLSSWHKSTRSLLQPRSGHCSSENKRRRRGLSAWTTTAVREELTSMQNVVEESGADRFS